MQLNPSEISELIRNRIQNLDAGAQMRTQGTVLSVTDGICRIHGLSDVMQGEMLEFPKNTFGLALNLERDSVGAVILGEYEHITEGDTDRKSTRLNSSHGYISYAVFCLKKKKKKQYNKRTDYVR